MVRFQKKIRIWIDSSRPRGEKPEPSPKRKLFIRKAFLNF